MIKSVTELRNERFSSVKKEPGVYIWWFKKECVKELLKHLHGVDISKTRHKRINATDYCALYFGMSKDCRGRAAWHMAQHHTPSSVRSGYLSTFRKTLSALLHKNMTTSEKIVNNYLDNNCYWEWEYTPSTRNAHDRETEELRKNYYPLNIQNNKVVPRAVTRELSLLRKKYQK